MGGMKNRDQTGRWPSNEGEEGKHLASRRGQFKTSVSVVVV